MNNVLKIGGFAHKVFAFLGIAALVLGMMPTQSFAQTPDSPISTEESPITGGNIKICHSGNGKHYGIQEPGAQSIAEGTSGHDANDEYDIIPPFYWQFGDESDFYQGKNWDEEGIELWKKDCVSPYQASITVTKYVQWGEAVASDFELLVDGEEVESGVKNTFPAGKNPGKALEYIISENDTDLNYELSSIECLNGDNEPIGTEDDSELTISLVDGDNYHCTITNTFKGENPNEGACEIEGHKYDQDGNPLANWFIGLKKFVWYGQDEASHTIIQDTTDENGYYCLEWDNADFSEVEQGYDSFLYRVFEKLQDGWNFLSIEKGTKEQNENDTLDVVADEDTWYGEGEVGTEIGGEGEDGASVIQADAEYHVDFYNQEEDGGEEPTPVCKIGKNLLQNASFEDPAVVDANEHGGGFWALFASIPKWTSTGDFELWNGVFGGGSAGSQNVELDVNGATTITQEVPTLVGATYELRFDFSARADADGAADNAVDAKVDGVTLVSATSTGVDITENTWSTFSKTFVATGTTTDISFADAGTSNGAGSLLDNAVLCLVEEPKPVDYCENIDGTQSEDDDYSKDVNGNCYMPIDSCSVSVVSDASNTYNDAGAIEITPNPAWVQTIASSLAKWIWGVPSNTPIDPVSDEVQTFVKTFVWSGTPSTAALQISSDNGYSVKLNGTVVGADAGEFNYQSLDTVTDITDNIIQGVNTLEISVTNKANGQTSLNTNPGGLLYDLTVSNTEGACDPDGNDGDEDMYKIYGYVWYDDNRNELWDGRFPNEGEEEPPADGENDLDGWVVRITNGQQSFETVTDENGYYEFNVPAGTWTITEEVRDDWMRTTAESHTVTVPEVVENTEESESVAAMIMSFLIPTAHAQLAPRTDYGEYNFGNDRRGGGGGNRAGDRDNDDDNDGRVLGDSDSVTPEPLVLGEQVSAVPTGAPDAGAGGAAPKAVEIFSLGSLAIVGRSRKNA